MASSVSIQAQAAVQTCTKHDKEEMDMYCKTCKKPLCHECVREGHFQHQWLPLKKYAKQLRANAQRREREVTSQLESVLNGQEKVFQYLHTDSESRKSQCMSVLETTRAAIHRITDEIIDKRKQEVSTFYDDRKRKRESSRKKLQREVQKLKVFRDQLKNEVTTLSNLDIIELYDEIDVVIKALGMACKISEDCFDVLEYKKGHANREALEEMIGCSDFRKMNIASISLTLMSSHIFGKSYVNAICPVSDSSAWIRCEGLFRLVSSHGEQISTSDSKVTVYNFDISSAERITFCHRKDQCVNCINESGGIETLYSTKPLLPLFITITHSGEHLVSLVDEDSNTRDETSRRLLRRVTKTGETIKEYEYDDDGRTPLFHKPAKSVEHYNGNLSVLNVFLSEENTNTGKIIGLTNNGTVRFKYEGRKQEILFNPIAITCDMMQNTIITDCENRCIHLIDTQGRFIMFLLTDMTFEPYAISLRDNRLWIGSFDDGQMSVYDYRYYSEK